MANTLRTLRASLICLSLLSCSSASDLSYIDSAPKTAYHLGAGDRVRVTVYGDEKMTGEYRIGDAGDINLPLIGTLHAGGLSTQDLKTAIANKLEQSDYMVNPSVAVEIQTYRPVFVLGEVGKPGQYPYQPGMTVLTAVAVAGGFTYRAVERYAVVTRSGDAVAIEGRAKPQALVEPGDVIQILERNF